MKNGCKKKRTWFKGAFLMGYLWRFLNESEFSA